MISAVEMYDVVTYEEAIQYFQEALADGQEGTILKATDGGWKDGKPNWQIKMKLEMDVDLRITGFNYGTGKNINVISSVNAESSDGKVVTRPTGINEAMMKYITDNQEALLGTIVECKCSGLSQDSEGNYSLLHPVFKSLRDDKDTCDDLQAIIDIERMVKGLA
jgi:ATP-dependent DNA ligase